MTDLEIAAIAVAQRQTFKYFLIKAFELLHPGESSLALGWYLEAMCHSLSMIHHGKIMLTIQPATTTASETVCSISHDSSPSPLLHTISDMH